MTRILSILLLLFSITEIYGQHTYCNPVNIDYRYCISRHNFGVMDTTQSYREGADPTMIVFDNEYYLFVSKSGGYWHSADMLHWNFITSPDINWEEYAPTVVTIDHKMYYLAAGQNLFCTADPASGKWEFVRKFRFNNFTDPCLFLDDDRRLYLYYGSADHLPLFGVKLLGRADYKPYQYIIEYSNDKKNWHTLTDKSDNADDYPHDYTELKQKVKARYFKITNRHTPDGTFAISGFRIFGKGNGKPPHRVGNIKVERNNEDKRFARITWDKVPEATGYNVKFGIAKDKLYLNYQVYTDNFVELHCLDKDADYFFEVESFNENGVSQKR